ncbi:formate/nitrite transporter family protein [Thermophilibacter provencensis]|uniref:Formate/nitrite transporter family protein n=1 Tax=Thermophilibacter provencensis TaxID=1852386 RepID=A0A921GEZ6_9ACTN|nr:formate/nitrite transporter family protein [Thermophilibacter provencensis]HJF45555.1 formate/nitrite transporter family protein [Thermophilibacter provencensis]
MKLTEKPSSSYSGAMTPASMELKNERVAETKAGTDLASALVLAVMSGAFISLGATFMLVVKSDATLPFAATQLLGGFAFTLGLFLVLAAGAELFTGNCLMVMGPLSGRFSWGKLLSSWLVVLAGNLAGALLASAAMLAAGVASANGGALGEAAIAVAEGKVALGWGTAFVRGVLCNMLVCLAVWVGHSASSVTDKFFSALLPVMGFMAAGFEHCVANMFFLPYAMMLQATGVASGSVDLAGVLHNLSAATLGNLVGGVVLVGASYWFVYGRGRDRA